MVDVSPLAEANNPGLAGKKVSAAVSKMVYARVKSWGFFA
jgi:hypothetical protein